MKGAREDFLTLTEFVEIWKRYLNGSLPMEVVTEIEHSEENLKPFYADLQSNFDRHTKGLDK